MTRAMTSLQVKSPKKAQCLRSFQPGYLQVLQQRLESCVAAHYDTGG